MRGRIVALALGAIALLAFTWLWLEPPAANGALRETPGPVALATVHVRPLSEAFDVVDPSADARSAATPSAPGADALALALRDPALTSTRVLHASATLLDEHGAPLAGGFMAAFDANDAPLTRTSVDASGRAELRIEVPDAFHGESHLVSLSFGAPGHATTRGSLRSFVGGGHFELGDVVLPLARRLTGRLVNDLGVPLAHTQMHVEQQYPPTPAPAGLKPYTSAGRLCLTDHEGRFEFAALHTLHATQLSTTDERGRKVRLSSSMDAVNLLEHDLGDVVWNPPRERRELLRLRVVDTDGRPLPGARAGVHLIDDLTSKLSEPESWLVSANLGEPADADGWVHVLEPAVWRMGTALGVAVVAPGHTARMLPHVEVRDADVELERGAPLLVVLRDAESGAALNDLDVSVDALRKLRAQEGSWVELERDTAPGSWIVRDAMRRDVRLVASQAGFGRRYVVLSAELERHSRHVIELAGPRVVTFRVKDPAGMQLSDVRARFAGPQGGPNGSPRYVDAGVLPDGSYSARGLEPGDYELRFWTDAAPDTTQTVTVTHAPLTELGDIELVTYGRVLLDVLDGAGAPSPHDPSASFLADERKSGARVTRLDDGRRLYAKLLPGRWAFHLEPSGHVEIDVRPGSTHEAQLRLLPWARVEGRVLREGAPVVGATVFALKQPPTDAQLDDVDQLASTQSMQWGLAAEREAVVTDDRGEFALELPEHPGTQLVALDPKANRSAVVQLDTVAGELSIADLAIERGTAVLEGLVRLPETNAPAGGSQIFVDGVHVGDAGPDGRFRITGLPPRAVRLSATHPDSSNYWFGDNAERMQLSADSPSTIELTAEHDMSGITFCSF